MEMLMRQISFESSALRNENAAEAVEALIFRMMEDSLLRCELQGDNGMEQLLSTMLESDVNGTEISYVLVSGIRAATGIVLIGPKMPYADSKKLPFSLPVSVQHISHQEQRRQHGRYRGTGS